MQTEELINVLAHAGLVRRPLSIPTIAAFFVGCAALITVLILGVRPELSGLRPPLSFWLKTSILACTLVCSVNALRRSSRPVTTSTRHWSIWLVAICVFLLAAREWSSAGLAPILSSVTSINFLSCIVFVMAYGLLGLVGLTLFMRRYAPINASECAGYIGLVSAASASLGYSIHCPSDGPTFIILAYGLPTLLLWALGRKLVPRYLDW